jgi:ABC-type phosphate transport system substrate-binding protein
MKLPTNGVPIYGGFLSVELKNRRGVTVWSYLATPGTSSEDVSKDISKRIAMHLTEALTELEITKTASTGLPSTTLSGAGATFPHPVYQKWFTNFQVEHPGIVIIEERRLVNVAKVARPAVKCVRNAGASVYTVCIRGAGTKDG